MGKPKEILFNGKTENGTMRIIHRKDFDEAIRLFGKSEVEIIVRKKRRTVSNPLRRYYFGVVVKMVMYGLKNLGTKIKLQEADEWVRDLVLKINPEVTHAFIKQRFIESIIVDEDTGEIIENETSTKRMTNTEFKAFYFPVYQFAQEFLGINIPDPDPDYKLPKKLYDNEKQEIL